MTPEKYDRYMREPNLRTQGYAWRHNCPWTPAEDEYLMKRWDGLSLNAKVDLAVRLSRTLIACKRRMTTIRRREAAR